MHVNVARRLRDLDTRAGLLDERRRIARDDASGRELVAAQSRLGRAKHAYAAARMQGVVRGFLARVWFRALLREHRAARRVQRTVRGWLGRRRWKAEYWSRVSVVRSKRALGEMLRRSRRVREAGDWRELFDPLTAGLWYFNGASGASTWDCPLPLQHRLVCGWEGYPEYGGLPSQPRCRHVSRSLQQHLSHTASHAWFCVACEHRNHGTSFPACELCGNSCGDGEGLHSAAQAMELGMTRMRRTLGKFLQLDAAASKDFIRGYRLSDRLVELALEGRAAARAEAGRTDADSELLLRVRFDEEPLPVARPAGGAHPVAPAPMHALLALPAAAIALGDIPAPAFDVIVMHGRPQQQQQQQQQPSAPPEHLGEQDLDDAALPEGALFVCAAFERGQCSRTTCLRAHPGLRDAALPIRPPGRSAHVLLCEAALQGACESAPLSCARYHPYLRPSTEQILRRVYPVNTGLRTVALPSRSVEFRGRGTGPFQGFGVMVWGDRALYAGEWRDGARHGRGVFRTAVGYEYAGGWEQGVRSGWGHYRHPLDNEVYEGQFRGGRVEGVGRLETRDGAVYEGEFVGGRAEGLGELRGKGGDLAVGSWQGGRLHGFGRYALRSGETYKGFFDKGRRHGRGVCTFSSGARFLGTWERGLPQGGGVFLAPRAARTRFQTVCSEDAVGGRYVGEFESGFLHGKGTYLFPNGDVYEGEWRRNRACGLGAYLHAAGSVYRGQWAGSQRCGQGTYTYPNGSEYCGYFERNHLNGRGIFRYATGAVYRGTFLDSRMHGRGIYTWPNGNEYRGSFDGNWMSGEGRLVYVSGCAYAGQWLRNKKHGMGKFVYSNGDVYVGYFREDRRHGRGAMRFCPDTVLEEGYEGEWQDDQMHGAGTYTYRRSEGTVYEGAFRHGRREGRGRLSFRDGSFYEGDFAQEQMHGLGTYVGAGGTQYEGEWARNQRHGEGTQMYADRTIYTGQFASNMRHGRGVTLYKDGRASHEGEWAEDALVGAARGVHTIRVGPGAGGGGAREVRVKVFGF